MPWVPPAAHSPCALPQTNMDISGFEDDLAEEMEFSQEQRDTGEDFVSVVKKTMDEQLTGERQRRKQDIQETRQRVEHGHEEMRNHLDERISELEQRLNSIETRLVTLCMFCTKSELNYLLHSVPLQVARLLPIPFVLQGPGIGQVRRHHDLHSGGEIFIPAGPVRLGSSEGAGDGGCAVHFPLQTCARREIRPRGIAARPFHCQCTEGHEELQSFSRRCTRPAHTRHGFPAPPQGSPDEDR